MTTPFTALDAWASMARSIRWSPLLVAPVAASAALLAIGPLAEADPVRIGMVGEPALAFSAAVVAFIADDPGGEAVPGTPVEAPVRFALRAGLMLPVATAGWLVVLALYAWVSPVPSMDLSDRALAGVGIASAAVGAASLGSRFRSVPSPGALGVAAVAVLGLALQIAPVQWLAHLPASTVLSPVTVLVSLLVVAYATREPAGS